MKPFLLSIGRVRIVRKYIDCIEHVIKVETDSFTLDSDCKIKNIGLSIGQLKFEYNEYVKF